MSHPLLCQQRTEVDVVFKQNLFYRPEYKKAHWWVRYDEKAGVEGMVCSMFKKWAEIPKENHVHLA